MHILFDFIADEGGQSMAEYAIILSLVAIAVFMGFDLLGKLIFNNLNEVSSEITGL